MLLPTVNFLAIIVAGLIPNILGAIYYGPLFGNTWRTALGKTEAELQPSNPALAYGGALVLSILLAFFINFITGMIHKDVNDAGELFINSHFTFGHGALHGAMIAGTILTPVIISLGIFHKTPAKVTLLNVVFWTICLAMMGGIIDVWR